MFPAWNNSGEFHSCNRQWHFKGFPARWRHLLKPVEKRRSGPTSPKKQHLPVRVVANNNIEYPWVNNTWQITFVSLK